MKVSQIINRENGSQVRITAEELFGRGLVTSLSVYVHHRQSPTQEWKLLSDKPYADWKEMALDDCLLYGKSEMLQAVTPAEILKVVSVLEAEEL